MKRLTMITKQLSKIAVLNRTAFVRLTQRVLLALLIALSAVAVWCPGVTYAASSSVPEYVPSEGTRFWVTFLSNNNGIADDDAKKVVQLVAASRNGATVTIHYSEGGTPQDVETVIPAGGQAAITVDKSRAYNLAAGKNSRSVLVTSTDTISLFASVRDDSKFESTYVLPEPALGSEYVIQNNRRNIPGFRSEFAIIATAPGITKIHIKRREISESTTPTTDVGIDDPLVSLTQGQVYFFKSSQQYFDDEALEYYYKNLSGTEIYAEDDKKIAVFQADEATITPFVSGYTENYTVEQALPLSSWGKEFLVVRSIRAKYEIVRITSAYASTTVTIKDKNGVESVRTLDAMSTFEFPFIAEDDNFDSDHQFENLYITANMPIMVSTLMPCKVKNSGNGAPSIAIVPPVRQGLSDVVIGTTNTANNSIVKYYADVVVSTEAVSSMRLDGAAIASNKFKEFGAGVPYSYAQLDLGSEGYHRLTNNAAPFVVTTYGLGSNNAYYYAAGFNTAPAAPIVKIDGDTAVHGDTLDYCNRHPGIRFTANVDYPHTGVKWDLGEGTFVIETTPDSEYEASHMYGATVGESDRIHDVRLYVYRESPISHVKDTDSVRVTLNVHPVYYDTLKTKVAAKHLTYTWDSTSYVPFGLLDGVGNPKYARFKLGTGKDSLNRQPYLSYNWANANVSQTIFDSLKYATRHDCDSMFYLKLQVVPDILMPAEDRTVCQEDPLAWAGHAAGAGHRMSRKNLTTNAMIFNANGTGADMFKTDEYGTFEIRDTLVSKMFPFPYSSHVMNLTINV